MPDDIQSGEYSTDSGGEDALYNSDGDPNLLNSNRNGDGQWLNRAATPSFWKTKACITPSGVSRD